MFFLNFYLPTSADPWPKKYYKGKFYDSVKDFFLVASKTMRDSRFKNTVIIMLDNNEAGAWGLVINKPLTSVSLRLLKDESIYSITSSISSPLLIFAESFTLAEILTMFSSTFKYGSIKSIL